MIVLYSDACAAVINSLAVSLASRTEPYAAGVTVSGELTPGADPQIVVTPNGVTSRVRNIVQRVTVRLVVWHVDDITALALAQLALALLDDAGFPTLTGPDTATDPESGRPIVAGTVRASMQGHLA